MVAVAEADPDTYGDLVEAMDTLFNDMVIGVMLLVEDVRPPVVMESYAEHVHHTVSIGHRKGRR